MSAPAACMLLTRDELVKLTGYAQPARMCAWLTSRGWHFEPPPRRGDIPRVSRAYCEARLAGEKPASPAGRREGPRLDWMMQPS